MLTGHHEKQATLERLMRAHEARMPPPDPAALHVGEVIEWREGHRGEWHRGKYLGLNVRKSRSKQQNERYGHMLVVLPIGAVRGAHWVRPVEPSDVRRLLDG